VLDSLVLCKFTAFAMKEDYYARLLSAFGRAGRAQELLRIGERLTVERLFNLAAVRARRRHVAARFACEPVPAGPPKAMWSTCRDA